MDAKLAELVGALLGDGFIENTPGHYRFGFVGHPIDDLEYYSYLSRLIADLWGKSVTPIIRERGLRMTISCKPAYLMLLHDLGLHLGKGKAQHAAIPQIILQDPSFARYVVRGIADTDGSIFCSKKPGCDTYPSIEITTCSEVLASQIHEVLLSSGFTLQKPRRYDPEDRHLVIYRVCLYGTKNLLIWMELIGFSNPTKLHKAKSILQKISQSKSSSSIEMSSLSSSSLPSLRKFSGSSVTP